MTVASDLAAAVQATTEVLRAACADPADAVRLLEQLATYEPIGAVDAAAAATAALCRRAALVSLSYACADCTLVDYEDAVALQAAVQAVFDAEILSAADAGDDAVYTALRTLRTATITDLATRAALLPRLQTVTTPLPMPSLVLGYSLYADATRADELAARAAAPHPGFMPTSFKALSA